MLLFLSVTPYGWLRVYLSCPMVGCYVHVVHGGLLDVLSSFSSEADWLSLWIFVTESRAGEGFALCAFLFKKTIFVWSSILNMYCIACTCTCNRLVFLHIILTIRSMSVRENTKLEKFEFP